MYRRVVFRIGRAHGCAQRRRPVTSDASRDASHAASHGPIHSGRDNGPHRSTSSDSDCRRARRALLRSRARDQYRRRAWRTPNWMRARRSRKRRRRRRRVLQKRSSRSSSLQGRRSLKRSAAERARNAQFDSLPVRRMRDGRNLSRYAFLSSPRATGRYFRLRPNSFSRTTMRVVVRRTVSGFRLIESMPRRTRNSAISG